MAKGQGKKAKRSSQVPGQFYGYSLQVTRAVAHLLRAHPGESVSVEYLDDVATADTGKVTVEQTKSGLAHNPVADRSVELWKTLHNWVEAIRGGALLTDTKFILYVAQPHTGSVIQRIHRVTNDADAAAVAATLRDEFWGPGPDRAYRSRLPSGLASHVNAVLASTTDVLVRLFANLTLEQGSGSPNDDLRPALKQKAISESALESVLQQVLGWAKRTIEKLIEKHQPAVLTLNDFHTQLIAAAKAHDRASTVLAPTPAEITRETVDAHLRERTYVRQLQVVASQESALERAVNDFLRASASRTAWSEQGDVMEPSFQDFQDALERAWDGQRTRVEIERRTETEEARGQLLHAACMGLLVRLQGMDVPAYFVPGSFHAMADSLHVGWHPRYRAVLAAWVPPVRSPPMPPGAGTAERSGVAS